MAEKTGPEQAEEKSVLLLTKDARITAAVAPVAAAAGLSLAVVAGREEWEGESPLVWLVGSDQASQCKEKDTLVCLGEQVSGAWSAAEKAGGVDVALLPEAASWLARRLASLTARHSPGRVMGLLSASGGSGVTTLAALLAMRNASAGRRVLLAEGDPLGQGIEDALDAAHCEGIRWKDLCRVKGMLNPEQVAKTLPSIDALSFLAHRGLGDEFPPPSAVESVIEALRRVFDLTIIDIGHGYKSPGSLVEQCEELYLLVPPTARGVACARDLAEALDGRETSLILAPSTGRFSRPPAEFVSELVGIEAAGDFPFIPELPKAQAQGALPVLASHRKLRGFDDLLRTPRRHNARA